MADDLGKELSNFLDDKSVEPVEPAAPVEPVEPVEPTEPVEPIEPVEPVKPVEPTKPVEPVEPVVPAEPIEPTPEVITAREKLLLERIEQLTGRALGMEEVLAPEVGPEPTPAQPAAPVVPAVVKPINFLEGIESLDDILDNPEKFNALLVKVHDAGKASATQEAVQKVLTSIPQLVTQYVGRHSTMTGMVDDFYKKNPDLTSVKRTVAAVANEVAAENPGQSVDKVFEETAIRTRKVLGLKGGITSVAPVVPVAPASPAFASQGSRKGTPGGGMKGLEKEINDLIS